VEKTRGRQSVDHAILLSSLAVLPTQIGNRDEVVELLREAIAFNVQTASADNYIDMETGQSFGFLA
jgi:hypothetical protein